MGDKKEHATTMAVPRRLRLRGWAKLPQKNLILLFRRKQR